MTCQTIYRRAFCWWGRRLRFAKVILNTRYPRFFLWLVVKDAILTWNYLQKRDWSSPGMCILCGTFEETVSHNMMQYVFSNALWMRCAQQISLTPKLSSANNIRDRLILTREKRKLHVIMIAAVCWNIWKEMNLKFFFRYSFLIWLLCIAYLLKCSSLDSVFYRRRNVYVYRMTIFSMISRQCAHRRRAEGWHLSL